MKKTCLNCFKRIAVPACFKIFEFLKRQGQATVNDLVKLVNLRQPTVTFHLNRLEAAGLITKSQVGREVYCRIRKQCKICPLFT